MNERGTVTEVLIGAVVILMVVGGIGSAILRNGYNRHEQTLHVQKAERVVSQGGKSAKYLVFADEGTYENVDSLLNGKWNSSDIYGQIKPGHTYKCLVYGWRNQFFSDYPNILKCEETK